MSTEKSASQTDSDEEADVTKLAVVVLLVTLPVDVLALSYAGLLPESVSLLSIDPLWGGLTALTGVLAGGITAYSQRGQGEWNTGKLFVGNVLLALPALGAMVYFSAPGYLLAFFVCDPLGYGTVYLTDWYRGTER